MVSKHAPKKGSRAFWPRRRVKRRTPRLRSTASLTEAKPVGFLGYKAGMLHVMAVDNRPKSLSKGEEVSLPVTVVECPPMKVLGAVFYKKTFFGLRNVATVLSDKVDKEFSRVASLPKKRKHTFDSLPDFDDVRLLVHTQPKLTGIGVKKPKVIEMSLGGGKDDKFNYAKEILGKDVSVSDVFSEGGLVDIHGISHGKGFQGPVKKFGVELRNHKSEKARRANVRGPWTGPKMWTAPHSGKMGYHQRTEWNKWMLKMGSNGKDVNPKAGLRHYGAVRSDYVLLKGSVIGPVKRVVALTHALRPTKGVPKEAPTIVSVVK